MQNQDLNFTQRGYADVESIIQTEDFVSKDCDRIFEHMLRTLRVPFSAHLIRYMYQKYRFEKYFPGQGAFDIPIKEYRSELANAFKETGTKSFEPTQTKLSQMIKAYLPDPDKQGSVPSRDRVLLLGFALQMETDEVNKFLTDAILDSELNPKSPREVLCWYCYENHLPFIKYMDLYEKYEKTEADPEGFELLYLNRTAGVRSAMHLIRDEQELMEYLSALKTPDNIPKISLTRRERFLSLYQKARELTAKFYKENDFHGFPHEEKTIPIEEITPADLDLVIASSVPRDKHGNQIRFKECMLYEQFSGHLLTKQRIDELLKDPEKEITRFDLITMMFYNHALEYQIYIIKDRGFDDEGETEDQIKRLDAFQTETNQILTECGFSDIYYANPYEAFILMCIACIDPLGTYSDVVAYAYGGEKGFED